MAPLRIGIMVEEVQLADIACIDLLGNMSTSVIASLSDVIATLGDAFPAAVREQAVEMEFHYISSTLEAANMTAGVKVVPTTTYDDAPRVFDILLIGGPSPRHHPAAAGKFMREAAAETKHIITTCTGSMWLASSGVLDGKKATTNRICLPLAKHLYPNVEWLDQRWVVDGKMWTAGGAFAGMGMVATYIKENFHEAIALTSLESLDVDPTVRGQFYKS